MTGISSSVISVIKAVLSEMACYFIAHDKFYNIKLAEYVTENVKILYIPADIGRESAYSYIRVNLRDWRSGW